MKKKIMIGGISLVAVIMIVTGVILALNSGSSSSITTGTKALEYTMENFMPSVEKLGGYFIPFDGNILTGDKTLYYVSSDYKMSSQDETASMKADFAIRPNLKELYFNGDLNIDDGYSESNLEDFMMYYDSENIYYRISDSDVYRINIDSMKELLPENYEELSSSFAGTGTIIEALSKIKDEDFERLYDLYVKAINKTITEDSFKESKTDIKLGSDSKEAVKWELDITEKLGVDIAVNFLKELKNDKELLNIIKEMVVPFVEYYGEVSGIENYEDVIKDLDIESYINELLENVPSDVSKESLGKIAMYAVDGELVRYKLSFAQDESEIGLVYNTYENSKGLSTNEIQLLTNNATVMIFKFDETSANKYDVTLSAMGQSILSGTCVNTDKEFSLSLTSEMMNNLNLDYTRKVVRSGKEEKIDFNFSMDQDDDTVKLETSTTIYTDKSVPKDVYANSKDVEDLTEEEKEEFAEYYTEYFQNVFKNQ